MGLILERIARAPQDHGAFLGVRMSARGFAWRERLDPAATNTAVAMSQRHGLPELLGRVLAARGVGLDDVPVMLDPTLKALMPDPSTLRDMDRAAARIADAISKRETIAVFGDYDVDGACAAALMQRFLSAHGLSPRVYIPDRSTEGYGPNPAAIESLVRDGASLIVTVDCGTTSFEPLAVARPLGTDIVVVDHHQADERLPDVAAVVNPNRQDDISGLGHLCAAGVTFMLLVATARELRRRNAGTTAVAELNLLHMLDLVALATVCDVVPLTGLNRAFVSQGLRVMRMRNNTGLRALCDAAGVSEAPTTYTLGYILGPRINAGGRIGDSGLGAKLLGTDDPMEAARIAVILDRLNKERRALELIMLQEGVAIAEQLIEADGDLPILIVGSERWHKGVVGLVASRLTERFRRPSCAIAWSEDGSGTGSLRSIPGVDIGTAVRDAVARGMLSKGGGHAMAAGLTVNRAALGPLSRFFDEALRTASSQAREAADLEIDGALTPQGANSSLLDLLERAGPYGQGNPPPRFAFPAHRVRYAKLAGDAHVRCSLEASDGSRLDAIAFRAAGQPLGELLLASGGTPIHIAGSLRRDTWGGRNRIELQVEDAADPQRQPA